MQVLDRPFTKSIGRRQSVVWHPLDRQELERDTTFMLDGATEAGRTVGDDAFIPMTYADTSWHIEPAIGQPGAKVAVVAGK